jgi:hypothetical protein
MDEYLRNPIHGEELVAVLERLGQDPRRTQLKPGYSFLMVSPFAMT